VQLLRFHVSLLSASRSSRETALAVSGAPGFSVNRFLAESAAPRKRLRLYGGGGSWHSPAARPAWATGRRHTERPERRRVLVLTVDPTPETVHWGYFDASLVPVARVRSGATVALTAVSGGPAELPEDEERFPVSAAHRAIIAALRPELGPHVLTGPIAVEDAEPGDVLEVRIDDVRLAQAWGYNFHRPLRGALPERFQSRRIRHIPIDTEARTATCPWGTVLPLAPFFGTMGVAPPPAWGRVSSVEPRAFGGNIDVRDLVAGSRLFLPVFVAGALFSAGDGHACQGDGEANLTALETALGGTFTLLLHKRRRLPRPRATTPETLITMAFDADLDDAATLALGDMIDALVASAGLAEADAYALMSLAGDLRITQIVNGNKGVHAVLKRSLLPPIDDATFAAGPPA
jgi:acetamidase/formamidase